ncbi:MAG TPA: YCF48-related protein, partial [Candidatus Thermoplasmatota archaeon]|nr:YCF48-related protein [Candidatus Thermoplasmatota archaeon]
GKFNLGVRESRDGGLTWTTVGLDGQVDFHAMTVSRADPSRLYGHFSERVYRSSDGGRTWEVVSTAPGGGVIALHAAAASADTLYAGTLQGLQVSRDGGATWAAVDLGLAAPTPIPSVTEGPAGVLFVAVHKGNLLRSSDGDAAWTPLPQAPPAAARGVGLLAGHPTDAETLYAAGFEGSLSVTRDGGRTWVRLLPPPASTN